jgi:hypothetical protein
LPKGIEKAIPIAERAARSDHRYLPLVRDLRTTLGMPENLTRLDLRCKMLETNSPQIYEFAKRCVDAPDAAACLRRAIRASVPDN